MSATRRQRFDAAIAFLRQLAADMDAGLYIDCACGKLHKKDHRCGGCPCTGKCYA